MSIENVTSEAIRRLVDGIFDKQQAAARILIFEQEAEIRRLRLTDEEKRAIGWAAEMLEVGSLPNSLNRDDARTLRGLLERLGERPVTEPMPGRPCGMGSVTGDNSR